MPVPATTAASRRARTGEPLGDDDARPWRAVPATGSRSAAKRTPGGGERQGRGRGGTERHGNQRAGSRRRPAAPVTPLARRRGRMTRRRRRLVQLVAALAAVAAVAWLLLAGPVLAVRDVRVDGLVTLPAEQVQEAAGIGDGTPLLRVDVEAAEARVGRLPQVSAVEVTRNWPDSVVITVVERVPVAIVGQPGRRSLVDADGVLFDMVTGSPPEGVVPLLVDSPGPEDPATLAGSLPSARCRPRSARRSRVRPRPLPTTSP
ncbi:cell division protein FtsQ/DivIB [Blastococcus brunescens]|uniref:FtsQ-type POTRA domain-containing protein n=1 Tax=Blastococcus brunescens TaxID=1564165 RepID=A0ABZ1B5L8_9ACTN|nr:FtsQ-type POTRA domain-containing protein [Blastococcus sp. BMG 8361]WRL66097.1 FtsQ-type POTRA domain-containing protein [Blastococcus sp. BMG 8361]